MIKKYSYLVVQMIRPFFLCCMVLCSAPFLNAQSVKISESVQYIKTYTFDEPNPVPILKENPKIYPYFKFEGYEYAAKNKEWKVVTLENDYIKLWVLPEVGGKIWGAIEKETGKEFIYKNDVLKFRNIAMRGPWTSGGVEFNFGIIGHTPATATPVDYAIKENKDGSVSCIVGTMDLPSRTEWRVEINLQKDKAYFETKASWYNPTPLNQAYYNWMTAAAVAKNDLEFFIPGNKYLEHGGNAKLWPIDEAGRTLSHYKNNNFGPHKSYHIVGDYKDFFGGYYHDTNFGFGHWSPYEEMPGQKLWLWALSRSGGVWEGLLTDTDGQYIEFQAGRLFNQYFPEKEKNPIAQANFEPHAMDRWREIWFPFKNIDGMVDASEYGVLNVQHFERETYIGVNSLQNLNEDIQVFVNDEKIINETLEMNPMDVFSKKIASKPTDKIKVIIGDNKLKYTTNVERSLIKRPFYSDTTLQVSKSQKLYTDGWEAIKYREYEKAFKNLLELIKIDPSHQEALVKLAELEYRKTNYNKALEYANMVLRMDTYNPEANYKAGIIYRAKKDYINALESLGWAARGMKYRSVSYAQMAEIHLSLNNNDRAKEYALKALDFNTYNLNARKVLIVLARKQNNIGAFNDQLTSILSIDPINHFAQNEHVLFKNNENDKLGFNNEFPIETALELSIQYENIGLTNEAIVVLKNHQEHAKIKLWIAYLLKEQNDEASQQLLEDIVAMPSDFVLPYRRETIPVLRWAMHKTTHWKLKYYLAQNYIAVGLIEEGKELLRNSFTEPDSDIFYRFRAAYLEDGSYEDRLQDYKRAIELNDNDWKTWDELIQYYLKNNKYDEAYISSKKAFKKFPKNYNIKLVYAKTLVKIKKYNESINVLKNIIVLPSELAQLSRNLYFDSHVFLANQNIQDKKYKKAIQLLIDSKKWPENLGVGKPYNVDNRLQDYLLAVCFEKLKNDNKKGDLLKDVVDYTNKNINKYGLNSLFGLLALKKLGWDAETNKLVSTIENSDGNKNYKLIMAFFKGDKKQLSKLKKDSHINEDLWSLIEESLSY
ncbi:DUF5107 domain-containing protein [Flavivirga spongiicola]|uniref:DUF5107 domain-containing protein n=1 Tax=Flavivirga spongiicola TaxID=421621 RepID=A0ABU7XQ13_9FLAO|nr:DUF5107 domain-containing protein [Flavivirga sp. MEBiC05379]MDO5977636.1 DUF5107 domain-containing protein [Flavivirga sp. MEBiC05379]